MKRLRDALKKTERDVSATSPRPQDALLNRPVPMAGVRGLKAAPSALAADEDSTDGRPPEQGPEALRLLSDAAALAVRGDEIQIYRTRRPSDLATVFPGGARTSVPEMEEDERIEEVIVKTDEEVMDVHTEDDVDGGETARTAEAIEDQEMQDVAPEAMDLYAQDDNHDSDGSVTDDSDSAEALI
ncbi:hypothetical protein C8R47DRAFT_1226507 [Mycena vitilis]|nr:hypothetical protein C8R47DRAFT_1226507 [Mycena vitilis]